MRIIKRLNEASVPLVVGLVLAVILANIAPTWHRRLTHTALGGLSIGGHELNLAFFVNDVFMTLFFGLAAVEIVGALRPGGSMHPFRRALNPVVSSGGVPALLSIVVAIAAIIFATFRRRIARLGRRQLDHGE